MRVLGLFRKIGAVPGLAAAALLAGVVFVFEPAQIYHGNSPFFSFSIFQIGPVLLAAFATSLMVLGTLSAAGGPRWRGTWAVVLSGLALAAWGSATFLASSQGLIDGRALFGLTSTERWRLNAGFLAFGIAGAIAAWRKPALTRRFLAALFIVLLAYSGWLVAKDRKPWRTSQQLEDLVTISQERNVVILILDAFQSDFFAGILEGDAAAASALEGFTYFPNAIGPAPTTYLSMPTIHSGAYVGEDERVNALYDKNVVDGSFVAKLSAAGFDAMVVNAIAGKCPNGARCAWQDVLVHGHGKALFESALYLLKLSLFRVSPGSLKPHFLTDDAGARIQVISSDEVFERMAEQVRPGAKEPTVRFVHLFSTHAPAARDGHCNSVRAAWSRDTAVAQGRCAIRRLSRFLDTLKERGLYDQTAIIVLADHGAGMSSEPETNMFWGADNWGAAASPLFLAKPFGARGKLATSQRVVGAADVGATMCAATAACRMDHGHDIFGEEWPPAYQFVAYHWMHRFWSEDKVRIDNRYEVRGPPAKISSWWRLTNLPRQPVGELGFGTGEGQEHFGLGWSKLEEGGVGHRWALGSESDLYLNLDPSSDAQIALQVATHSENPNQVMTIEINGTSVGEIQVLPGCVSTARVSVPAGVVTAGADRILFLYSQWNSQPSDPRPLSVSFHNLKILGHDPIAGNLIRDRMPRCLVDLASVTGRHPRETDGINWWNWAENSLLYSYRVLGRPAVRLRFSYMSIVEDAKDLKVIVKGNEVNEFNLKVTRSWNEFISPPVQVGDSADLSIRIESQDKPVRISPADPRMASFMIRNLELFREDGAATKP
jgi:hypothetical protein